MVSLKPLAHWLVDLIENHKDVTNKPANLRMEIRRSSSDSTLISVVVAQSLSQWHPLLGEV